MLKGINFKMIIILTVSALSLSIYASAEEKIHVGVAANYIQVFNEISGVFEAETGYRVEAAFTSSGSIYGQIVNGAPYDMFLSADELRPARLFKEGLAEKPFIYAEGRVILWSADRNFCKSEDWKQALTSGNIKKIAIANYKTAPYGMAAMEALQKTGMYNQLKSLLVNSQDIAQAFQYASTGAVDAGFCAYPAIYTTQGRNGCYYIIKEAPVIIQSACILKRSENYKIAEKFALFLVSEEASKIKEKYGYR